jgi:hypothetical protein
MEFLSEYVDGTRTAHIYPRTYGGYRIVLLDSYFETQEEKYASTEQEAETIAEDWVMKC